MTIAQARAQAGRLALRAAAGKPLPRVLPKGRGAANELGLAFYDRLIDGLLAAGIEPWLCLYHWDLPQALQDLGGWINRDIAQWFGGAGDVLRAEVAKASIGAIHNMQPARPVQPTPADKAAAAILGDFWNRAFPDPQILGSYPPSMAKGIEPYRRGGDMERIRRPVDWLGINHYSPIYANADQALS